jgi:hypothetical protein
VAHQLHATLAQNGHALPRNVFAKKAERTHRRPRPEIRQGGKPSKRMTAEEIAPVLLLEMTPRKGAKCRSAKKAKCCKTAVT